MNSLETARVLAVLDDALEGNRLLSFINAEVLEAAEQLRDILGEDIANALVRHRQLAVNTKAGITSDALVASSYEVLRLMKKSPVAEVRLMEFQVERAASVLQVLHFTEKLKSYAQRRLTTTVEEDASNREFFSEVRDREEKAVSEKVQLEQKLKLQRIERSKQTSNMQTAEDRSRNELNDVQATAASNKAALLDDAAQQRQEDVTEFTSVHDGLSKELAAAKAALAKLRDDARETEAALRKAKKRAEQDVEAVIGEYDGDLGAKLRELRDAQAAYSEVQRQLEEYTDQHNKMKKEREAHEERERLLAVAKQKEAVRLFALNHAAKSIQNAWKDFKEAKKKKKAGGKKKKGAKGKK